MEALAKTRRIGGSLVVTIPRIIVEQEGLSEDQTITITVKKAKKSWFGVAKGIAPFSEESKLRGQLEEHE